jgi:hypothetical protein
MRDLFGIEVRAINPEWLPKKRVPARAVPSDWRERLHRNLSRPSTGKWEPLEVDGFKYVPDDETVYLFSPGAIGMRGSDVVVMHPKAIAMLTNLGREGA